MSFCVGFQYIFPFVCLLKYTFKILQISFLYARVTLVNLSCPGIEAFNQDSDVETCKRNRMLGLNVLKRHVVLLSIIKIHHRISVLKEITSPQTKDL